MPHDINSIEYQFEIALQERRMDDVKKILQQGLLCGHGILNYLKEEGFSDLALLFEKDPKARFNLALSSANIMVAFEMA